ncbi:PIN domain-containing protein [Microbacterium sp. 11MF]|uniref:PIN domain-containing protein n=1 Tax=Microbacterium sp. 11MF TaxID=1169146 RepID=UPI00037DEACD|nr:PIN domain-containing protein [Microbacterium sp. 11MF]
MLNTTELMRDFRLDSICSHLLAFAISTGQLNVCTPVVAIEELVAHHGRQVEEALSDSEKLKAKWRRLGLGNLPVQPTEFDYREYVRSRLDFVLGFRTLPWPRATHAELVHRATNRVPPFDDKGGGYRDSLVWTSTVELASEGIDVVLVSADRAFSNRDDGLSDVRAAEIAVLPGTVELARDLAKWLIANLGWRAESLDDLLQEARDEEVNRMLHDWDSGIR